jgi:hypothetical protein
MQALIAASTIACLRTHAPTASGGKWHPFMQRRRAAATSSDGTIPDHRCDATRFQVFLLKKLQNHFFLCFCRVMTMSQCITKGLALADFENCNFSLRPARRPQSPHAQAVLAPTFPIFTIPRFPSLVIRRPPFSPPASPFISIMGADWSSACTTATTRSSESQLALLYGCSSVTVSFSAVSFTPHLTRAPFAQIVCYCLSAGAGGYMFTQWLLAGRELQELMWPLFGRFTALIACGSFFGIVTWAAFIGNDANQFIATDLFNDLLKNAADVSSRKSHIFTIYARSNYWYATWLVFYAFEFLMVCVAKLTVLFRMLEFAAPKANDELRRRLALFLRAVMTVVILFSVGGICANAAAAATAVKTGDLFNQAAAAYAANRTAEGADLEQRVQIENAQTNRITSVQQFCEVLVLLIIIIAFTVAGTLCARRILTSKIDRANSKVSKLIRQIFGTIAVIFITFMLRSVYAVINAVTQLLEGEIGVQCGLCRTEPIGATPCNNMYALIQNWLIFTPEFQLLVVLISSPLSLLVSLWGMTSENTRAILSQRKANTDEENLTSMHGLRPAQ